MQTNVSKNKMRAHFLSVTSQEMQGRKVAAGCGKGQHHFSLLNSEVRGGRYQQIITDYNAPLKCQKINKTLKVNRLRFKILSTVYLISNHRPAPKSHQMGLRVKGVVSTPTLGTAGLANLCCA